ncbi:MAG TPA: hypothetical protein VLC98_03385 [Phnomibacter sp.]|nr:hypothetical protein [Phnomibacter sp.]
MLKLAILDLYEGFANQGMRGIREIIHAYEDYAGISFQLDEFDVRSNNEIPDLTYDIYISTGGPGSPLDSKGSEWDNLYMEWLQKIHDWNAQPANFPKKHVFFICHSFQLACRHFEIANVCERKSTSFGVFPIHMLQGQTNDPIFAGLQDPFYAVDSRDYQVIEPNHQKLAEMGASILCIEKARPHIPLERAIMAIRFNDYFFGTQFHPEADAIGMSMYLQKEDKKKTVIENHGEEKWQSMLEHLGDPDKIMSTHDLILPNFLKQACTQLLPTALG